MKTAILALLLASAGCLAGAEPPPDTPPAVSYAPFPLAPVRTHVSSEAGIPVGKAEMVSPLPNDFPPSTVVGLEDARTYPANKRGGRYFFPGRNILRVYRISAVEQAPYKTVQPQIATLKEALQERPTNLPTAVEKASTAKKKSIYFPDYPPRNAIHIFQLKTSYLDADWGSGVFYITQFSQDGGTSANNEELTYLFQGISKDGDFYVSADFRITHPKLPAGIDDAHHSRDDDFGPDERLLSKQPDDSFHPSLSKLRAWVASLKIE